MEKKPSLTRPDDRAPRQVLIPGGRVLLGAPDRGPQRPVDVDSFLLDVTEVTAGQFAGCIQAGACQKQVTVTPNNPNAADDGEDARRRLGCTLHAPRQEDHPITCVTWSQAQAFCTWAEARLPASAEWILAAAGSEGRKYPWGSAEFDGSQANLAGAELEEYLRQLHKHTYWASERFRDDFLRSAPVGSFSKGVSPQGVYDLYGNVMEWLADTECAKAPCTEIERAIRGYSWAHGLVFDIQSPMSSPEGYGSEYLGFRCAASMGR